jgi:hypothetical protein
MLTMDISQRMIYFYRPSITCNGGISYEGIKYADNNPHCVAIGLSYNCAYKSSYKQVELVDCQLIENLIELDRTSYYLTIGTQYNTQLYTNEK